METQVSKSKEIEVVTTLSIRRKPGLVGLPGDDPANYNLKVGSALKGDGVLRGLDREEEKKYLPIVTNIYPEDHMHWLEATKNYWSNISVSIPADNDSENPNIKGKVIIFTTVFPNAKVAEGYKLAKLEDKAKIIREHGTVIEGISSYILFRYCLVYSRVANSISDVYASPRIRFYLFSKDQEVKRKYDIFKDQTKATKAFLDIMENEQMLDAVLRMFKKNPDTYESIGEKHLEIDKLKTKSPAKFLGFIKDRDLTLKASIMKAVKLGVIYNPSNTESYYYGADNDILLGSSLLDVVLYFKSEDIKKVQIRDSIKAQLKSIK